jgi:acetyl esterase/lipase
MRTRTRLLALAALTGAAVLARGPLAARRAAVDRVPPELRAPICWLPLAINGLTLPLLRRLPPPPTAVREGVTVVQRTVGLPGRRPVPVHVYEPSGRDRPSGAVLWIHGGGLVIGDPVGYHDVCSRIADEVGVLVVNVDYRLAPENPFPAGLEDCYTALAWLHESADELGVDRARLAVAGDSAGGGIAASLAQVARDRGHVDLALQCLLYPMLDDRTVLREDHAGRGELVWTPSENRFGWTSWLGGPPVADAAPPYAAAARREDLSGLPPAWIGVGDLDLFFEEDVDYAERLRAAGVACDLHVVPGMYHATERFRPDEPRMADFSRRVVDALREAVGAPVPGRVG